MGDTDDPTRDARRRDATEVFLRAVKANNAALHRAINRAPKGAGWVQCHNAPPGMLCRPEPLRAALALFEEAYAIWPDIVALNQVALGHEMLGDREAAHGHYQRMQAHAMREGDASYLRAAEEGLARTR